MVPPWEQGIFTLERRKGHHWYTVLRKSHKFNISQSDTSSYNDKRIINFGIISFKWWNRLNEIPLLFWSWISFILVMNLLCFGHESPLFWSWISFILVMNFYDSLYMWLCIFQNNVTCNKIFSKDEYLTMQCSPTNICCILQYFDMDDVLAVSRHSSSRTQCF